MYDKSKEASIPKKPAPSVQSYQHRQTDIGWQLYRADSVERVKCAVVSIQSPLISSVLWPSRLKISASSQLISRIIFLPTSVLIAQVVLYGLEVCLLTKTNLRSLDFPINRLCGVYGPKDHNHTGSVDTEDNNANNVHVSIPKCLP